jgi:hypothetical protein
MRTVGADEVKADCLAVQRGRRNGWLSGEGLGQICEFMQPARADNAQFNGSCKLMQQCLKQTGKQQRSK